VIDRVGERRCGGEMPPTQWRLVRGCCRDEKSLKMILNFSKIPVDIIFFYFLLLFFFQIFDAIF
jgi:hypothetical protein